MTLLSRITNYFALWTVFGTLWAWIVPAHFTWMVDGSITILGAPLISVSLGLIMLGMGMTLSFDDYARVVRMPKAIAIGVAAQFIIMPLAGAAIASIFALETGLAVGLILVACCPGGTASNVVAYLARGNVALSVAMTMVSTFAAIALTPLLTGALAGKYVEIDRWNLFVQMIAIVLVPVVLGTLMNRLFPRIARQASAWSPLVSVLLVVLIVGGIVGASKALIIEYAGVLLLAVFLLHATGFGLGFLSAKWLGLAIAERRTVSIEVGMQNSGLGSSLASTPAFAAQFSSIMSAALAPVPSAISAVYHVLIGSLLAAIWRRK